MPYHGEFTTLAVTQKLFSGNWATVTQDTSITTGVTVTGRRGQITTVDPALAAAGEAEFAVTNTDVHADDIVMVAVVSGPADGEHVMAFVSSISEGAFTIVLSNLAAANQADGAMVIAFVVL